MKATRDQADEALSKFKVLLLNFLNSKERAVWIRVDGAGEIYLRKSYRFLEVKDRKFVPEFGKEFTSLDIPNIQITPDFQHLGIFKRFLEYAESINPYPLILIEEIQNYDLLKYVESVGYTIKKESERFSRYKVMKRKLYSVYLPTHCPDEDYLVTFIKRHDIEVINHRSPWDVEYRHRDKKVLLGLIELGWLTNDDEEDAHLINSIEEIK